MITLAVMLSERASLTLSILATVIWLPWALLSVRRSAWAWMTVAMLAMLWRGESWKALYLIQEAQVSQLPPQCLQLLPKTAFYGQSRSFLCADLGSIGRVLQPFDRLLASRDGVSQPIQPEGRYVPGTYLGNRLAVGHYSLGNSAKYSLGESVMGKFEKPYRSWPNTT
jgi:hypothetical protein